jgi:hypothetical protein
LARLVGFNGARAAAAVDSDGRSRNRRDDGAVAS